MGGVKVEPQRAKCGSERMGVGIRHVVVVSSVLAMGAFGYVVGFAPMDEGVFVRAGAMNAVPTRARMIQLIRRALAQGKNDVADRMGDALMEHNPEEPSAYFWRAMISIQMGDEDSATMMLGQLDAFLEPVVTWNNNESASQLNYYRAWGKIGLGDMELGESMFRELADQLEAQNRGPDGVIWNTGALYNLACYRAMGGEIELAMGFWERAVSLGYTDDGGWWAVDPDLNPLHDTHQFWKIGDQIVRSQPVSDDELDG